MTPLIEKVFALRKKRFSEFSVDDIRLVLGQKMALEYLMPRALDLLERNITEDADMYPGALLIAVMGVGGGYWGSNPGPLERIQRLLAKEPVWDEEVEESDKKTILRAIKQFKKI